MTQTVSYISLSDLLSQKRAPESIVCFDDNSKITWQTFNDDLSQLVNLLSSSPVQRVAICAQDSYQFSVAFLLGDEEKVKFSEAEQAATLERLDKMIAQLGALRTEVEDPDGYVRFTLGDDGRLLELFIHEAARTSLTNLALEKKLNDLFAAANEAMMLSRKEFWDHYSITDI